MTRWGKEQRRQEHVPCVSPALGCSSWALSPQQAQPLPPALGSCGLPCIVLSGKQEGQTISQSSAPDTRWLRGSARFSKRHAGFLLLPAGGLAVPCSARSAGRPDGPAQGHGTAPRPTRPVTGFQARRGRGWGSSHGGTQPVRATCRRGSWSPALCSVPPGDEARLSLR